MKYLSVCSGIEAATVAWHPLGWDAVAYSEIEPFPSAVLAHHYPKVPNYGDMTRFKEWPDACICVRLGSERQGQSHRTSDARLRSSSDTGAASRRGDYSIRDEHVCKKCGGSVIDLLVGGTPCQSFSVAGLRKGLDDPRGNLALTYLAVVDRYRPRWMVWENVPGVLSADDGRALGAFLGGLAELGYGFTYRVLDAQHFGLAQRRARVFVVGHLGDWRRAAAVLFERESLSGHPAPRREAGEVAPTGPSRRTGGGGLGTDFDCDGGLIANERTNERTNGIPHRALCLNAGGMGRIDAESETLIPTGGFFDVAHALRADGFDASEDGIGRGTPLVACFDERQVTSKENRSQCGTDVAGTMHEKPFTLAIRGRGDSSDLEYREDGTANAILTPNGGRGGIGVGAVAFNWQSGGDARGLKPQAQAQAQAQALSRSQTPAVAIDCYNGQIDGDTALTLRKGNGNELGGVPATMHGMQVRRLTPRECERLQGFPDDYTLIPYRGKFAADGPRYKALGNSMAVPVMAWIGRRIQMVEELT